MIVSHYVRVIAIQRHTHLLLTGASVLRLFLEIPSMFHIQGGDIAVENGKSKHLIVPGYFVCF